MSKQLKDKLAKGQAVAVINPDHPSASLVESLGRFGFDGAFIDCEHGSANMETVEKMARAARVSGMASIVRPETNVPWLITRYLHRGVDGVMVPLVHTAEAARSVVQTVRYACPNDYDDRFIVVMIESAEGIDNLSDILKVEGIDVFFLGPGDLSQSMGYQSKVWEGQERPAEVVLAMEGAFKTILGAGKVAGTLVNRLDVQSFVRQGVLFLYDHANHFLARGAKDFLDLVKAPHEVP